VEDSESSQLQTYDSGVAFVFNVPTFYATSVSMNFVGVLKDILKLYYGPLHTPVIILRCEWVKGVDNQGNVSYVKDDYGFLTMNF